MRFGRKINKPLGVQQPKRSKFTRLGQALLAASLVLIPGSAQKTDPAPNAVAGTEVGFWGRTGKALHKLVYGEEAPSRTVYVLHSGMRDPNNEAALSLQQALKKRGVKEADMIVMPAVYPSMDLNVASKELGKGVKENIAIFKASVDSQSELVQNQFQAYQVALKKAGVRPIDKIVWVGDSAGGQMGFTLAKLAKDRQALPMDTIITLGSPIAKNDVPPEVKIRHYTSSADQVQNGRLLGGQVGQPLPDHLDGNDRIRYFNQIGHCDWYTDLDPAIVDRILSETQPEPAGAGVKIGSLPFLEAPIAGGIMSAVEQRATFENNQGVAVPDNGTKVNVGGLQFDFLTQVDKLGQFLQKRPPAPSLKSKP